MELNDLIFLAAAKATQAELARKFEVTHTCIWSIVRGVNWKTLSQGEV